MATYTQPTLVRVIDASYIAPAANVDVEEQLVAANVGSGTITPYGTFPANAAAPIEITAATGGAALLTTSGTLLPGHQYSVFLTDNGAAPTGYPSPFSRISRCRRQRPIGFSLPQPGGKTGAVDIYMVPAGQRSPTPFRWLPISPSEARRYISALPRNL